MANAKQCDLCKALYQKSSNRSEWFNTIALAKKTDDYPKIQAFDLCPKCSHEIALKIEELEKQAPPQEPLKKHKVSHKVIYGCWEMPDIYDYGWICSHCGWDSCEDKKPKFMYCPNCGAKMYEEI